MSKNSSANPVGRDEGGQRYMKEGGNVYVREGGRGCTWVNRKVFATDY